MNRAAMAGGSLIEWRASCQRCLINSQATDIPNRAFSRPRLPLSRFHLMHEYEHVTPTPGSIDVIIAAAGSGSRFGDSQNKLFATLAGRPLWIHTIARLSARAEVGRIVMAV